MRSGALPLDEAASAYDAEKKGTSQAARVRALADELTGPLAEHGFDAPEDYQAPGGWSGLESTNGHGGRLTILEGGGWVQVSVSGPVEVDLDRCDDAALA
ncbi:hypothetical protein ACXET9_12680 [Brachybacterium sp. DNPG3]